jgi:hypothetical protein
MARQHQSVLSGECLGLRGRYPLTLRGEWLVQLHFATQLPPPHAPPPCPQLPPHCHCQTTGRGLLLPVCCGVLWQPALCRGWRPCCLAPPLCPQCHLAPAAQLLLLPLGGLSAFLGLSPLLVYAAYQRQRMVPSQPPHDLSAGGLGAAWQQSEHHPPQLSELVPATPAPWPPPGSGCG